MHWYTASFKEKQIISWSSFVSFCYHKLQWKCSCNLTRHNTVSLPHLIKNSAVLPSIDSVRQNRATQTPTHALLQPCCVTNIDPAILPITFTSVLRSAGELHLTTCRPPAESARSLALCSWLLQDDQGTALHFWQATSLLPDPHYVLGPRGRQGDVKWRKKN